MTFESIETQLWVTKTVWQRIPSRRARHRKAPTTETVGDRLLGDRCRLFIKNKKKLKV